MRIKHIPRLACLIQQLIFRTVIQDGTHMKPDHLHMLGIATIEHRLRVFEGLAPLERAPAIPKSLVKHPPCRVQPKQIERNPLLTHPLAQGRRISIRSHLLVLPRASGIRPQMKPHGKPRQHRRLSRQVGIPVKHCIKIGTIDKIIVQLPARSLKRIRSAVAPTHIPLGRISRMEENAITLGAHHKRHRAIIGTQDVLASHGWLASPTEFHVQVNLMPTLVHEVHPLSETEEVLIATHHGTRANRIAHETRLSPLGINHFSPLVHHYKLERLFPRLNAQTPGFDVPLIRLLAHRI